MKDITFNDLRSTGLQQNTKYKKCVSCGMKIDSFQAHCMYCRRLMESDTQKVR